MAFFCRYAFFILLLIVGLSIFKDYGVHFDEDVNQYLGNENYQYFVRLSQDHSLRSTPGIPTTVHALTHGPCIEIFLNTLKNVLHLTDPRDILLMRHLSCFLFFFIGVYFFYLLCDYYFNNWKIALIGCLFLVVSPRIFADAFYNTYDGPFISLYIISVYTLLRWLKTKSFLNAFFCSISSAFLFDLRPVGIIIPFFAGLFFCIDILKASNIRYKINLGLQYLSYLFFLFILIVAAWPLLWPHPWHNLLEVINTNYHFRYYFAYKDFFLGQDVKESALPWYYAPVWIAITTPIVYIFYFIAGLGSSLIMVFKNRLSPLRRELILVLLCFFLPLYLGKGKVYDTWRHLYFIYPMMVIIALNGLVSLWQWAQGKTREVSLKGAIILATVVGVMMPIVFMVRNHPFQYVYFNSLAGRDMSEIKKRFVMDFWGISYRQGLELILKKDSDEVINVSTGPNFDHFISNNLNILPLGERKRFKETDVTVAKYMIINYQWYHEKLPYPLYASIKVGNADILGIYRLK